MCKILINQINSDSTSTVSSTSTTQSLASSVTKPKFSLPFFCIYISWFLSLALIVLSSFFLWAYGISYGNDFISKWFISFVLSFFTSFFVFEPLKVKDGNAFTNIHNNKKYFSRFWFLSWFTHCSVTMTLIMTSTIHLMMKRHLWMKMMTAGWQWQISEDKRLSFIYLFCVYFNK